MNEHSIPSGGLIYLSTWELARRKTVQDERKQRVLGSCILSKRKAKSVLKHVPVRSLKPLEAFKLSKKKSDAFPFRLLGQYVEALQIDNLIKDEIYEKISARNPDVVSYIKNATDPIWEKALVDKDIVNARMLYQVRSLLKKYPFPGNAEDCRNNATDRFFEAEEMCANTNKRLRHLFCNRDLMSDQEYYVYHEARRIIAQVLGPLDRLMLIKNTKAGPGLINRPGHQKSSETTAFFKYTEELFSTQDARFFTQGMVSLDPHWMDTMRQKVTNKCPLLSSTFEQDKQGLDEFVKLISGNRVTFVPKDATTDRAIAIEPSGNVMLQLGVGSYIKTRLTGWGINLTSQAKNRAFAKQGSYDEDNSYCTIDLRMASDTLSLETVRTLLPSDWFTYMDNIRSSVGTLKTSDGPKEILYEKFSSMGNGFTFELESLIFFALTLASMRFEGFEGNHQNDISVFGDDVICRKQYTASVISSFEFFGFEINRDKSFISGNFRESCGQDYVFGHDVRPFFLKRKVSSLRDIHFVANSMVYKCISQKSDIHWKSYEFLFRMIPRDMLLPGPLEFTMDTSHKLRKELEVLHGMKQKTEINAYSDEVMTSDLESCLKVPLRWAIDNGFYDICPHTFSMRYRRLIVTAVDATNRSEYKSRKEYSYGRYHIFLQGVLKGGIVLRDVTRVKLTKTVVPVWDDLSLSANSYLPSVLLT